MKQQQQAFECQISMYLEISYNASLSLSLFMRREETKITQAPFRLEDTRKLNNNSENDNN